MTKARDLANGGFGLVLVKPSSVVGGTDNGKGTISFSGVTSVSLNNVFNSTYTKYRILIDTTLSANDGWYMQLRANGSNASGAGTYGGQVHRADATSSAAARYTATNWDIDYTRSAGNLLYEIELFNPFAASQTYGFSRYTAKLLADTTQMYHVNQGLTHTPSTSYDGFTMFTGTAVTATGSISVYGYNR